MKDGPTRPGRMRPAKRIFDSNGAPMRLLVVMAFAVCQSASTGLTQPPKTVQYSKTLTLKPVPASVGNKEIADRPWLVNIDNASVREGPSLEANISGTLAKNTEIPGVYYVVQETDEEWLEVNQNGRPGYVSRLGLSRVHPENIKVLQKNPNFPYGSEVINRWWGIPLEYEPNDLVDIPAKYVAKVTVPPEGLKLRRDAAESFAEMNDAIRADGLSLYATSSYRSGPVQLRMFLLNMEKDMSQRRCAPPGHSEHQLGTTVDLATDYGVKSTLKISDPQYEWLTKNAARFGWYQSYQKAYIDQTGYIEEPWHWRYTGVKVAEAPASTKD